MKALIPVISLAMSAFLPQGWAQDTAYYRVQGLAPEVSTRLLSTGVLEWSSSAHGQFIVERSTELLSGLGWATFTRGTATADLVSIKVADFGVRGDRVFVPAGYCNVGDVLGDLKGVANPPHDVYVNAFFLQRYEFTQEEMRQALQWAFDRGMVSVTNSVVSNVHGTPKPLVVLDKWDSVFSYATGKFAIKPGREHHPAVYVTWHGAVALCNFKGEMEGLPLCYDLDDWSCRFDVPGYRLPTEGEWERAARGGVERRRFPWTDSNEITHSLANYKSDTNNVYDVSPTRGYHPMAPRSPYTTPIGTFQPNAYGLYDMAGNAWEWCWDWAGKYPPTTQFNPTGPSTGTYRVFRGGSCLTTAERLTCAMRYLSANPSFTYNDIGFRWAITILQEGP